MGASREEVMAKEPIVIVSLNGGHKESKQSSGLTKIGVGGGVPSLALLCHTQEGMGGGL